jgi:hypothetical protein
MRPYRPRERSSSERSQRDKWLSGFIVLVSHRSQSGRQSTVQDPSCRRRIAIIKTKKDCAGEANSRLVLVLYSLSVDRSSGSSLWVPNCIELQVVARKWSGEGCRMRCAADWLQLWGCVVRCWRLLTSTTVKSPGPAETKKCQIDLNCYRLSCPEWLWKVRFYKYTNNGQDVNTTAGRGCKYNKFNFN